MGYKRIDGTLELLRGEELTRAMAGVGMNFAVTPAKEPNIEDTLLAASVEAMELEDLRVFSVLVTWLTRHHSWINADRLVRALSREPNNRVRCFWAASARWLERDRRLARLAKIYRGSRLDLLRTGTEFQMRRKGEDARFSGGPLRVPEGVVRDRSSDALSPIELAKHHTTYHHRVLMGPSYRADMWAALELAPNLSPTELARRTYGSFATAWQVKRDWQLLAA